MLEKIVARLQTYVSSKQDEISAIRLYDEALALHSAKKYRNAFPIMQQAANLGHKDAMALLGSMYLLGNGVFENGNEALKWLHKAVDAGQVDAVGVLGMAYATGKAKIKQDIEKGRALLEKAAQLGDEKSIQMISMIDRGEGMFSRKKTNKSGRN